MRPPFYWLTDWFRLSGITETKVGLLAASPQSLFGAFIGNVIFSTFKNYGRAIRSF